MEQMSCQQLNFESDSGFQDHVAMWENPAGLLSKTSAQCCRPEEFIGGFNTWQASYMLFLFICY
jgi:hypothetical protein